MTSEQKSLVIVISALLAIALLIFGCEEQGTPTIESEQPLMAPAVPIPPLEKPGAVKALLVDAQSNEFGWVIFNISANGVLHINVHYVDEDATGESIAVYLAVREDTGIGQDVLHSQSNLPPKIGELKLNKQGSGNFHHAEDVSGLGTDRILARVVICHTSHTEFVPLQIK